MGVGDEKRLRFGRRARLRTGSDFGQVRQQGSRLASGCMIANWLRQAAGAPSRLGVVTSAKLGGAVQRNRVRRLLRECYRLHQHELRGPVDLVLVARPAIVGRTRAQVEQDFLTTVRKAGLLL